MKPNADILLQGQQQFSAIVYALMGVSHCLHRQLLLHRQ